MDNYEHDLKAGTVGLWDLHIQPLAKMSEVTYLQQISCILSEPGSCYHVLPVILKKVERAFPEGKTIKE